MRRLKIVLLLLAGLTLMNLTAVFCFQEKVKAETKKIEGIWEGTLKISAMELRVVFKISATDSGLSATMDSPDQGARGIPVSAVRQWNDSLRLEVQVVNGYFLGAFRADTLIAGNWDQSGFVLPLELKRVEKESAVNRPQEPKPPFPYCEEEVAYPNEAAAVKLAGTLTLPQTGAPFPAVILITGSGPQNRDEELLNHKPFKVIADYLTRRGLAVLRVDDRGVGGSTGNVTQATSEDFAGDVVAGIQFLKRRTDINPKQIGLIGHSEGGIIAPLVATKAENVAFIVLLAGTGLTGEEILYLQSELIQKASGASADEIEKSAKQQRRLYQILKENKEDSVAQKELLAVLQEQDEQLSADEKGAVKPTEQMLNAQVNQLISPWFRFFLTYDPKSALEKVRCPVLALIGEKDLQVPPKENLRAIEAALKKGGNLNYTLKELPDLNHLFQHAATGSPTEYAKIEETFAPEVLTLIGDWIWKQQNTNSNQRRR